MRTALRPIRVGGRISDAISVVGKINGSSTDPVYLVWNHEAWCPMVCKMFSSPRRAHREATALSSLSHPNIVRCLGYQEPSYVLMEFLEGPALSTLIARQPRKRLSVSNAIRVAIHLGAALEHMHAKGFLHMDVKPGNVIVVHGRPVLFDFGSMRVTKDPRPPRIDGTDPYIAPEEALMTTVGASADVFSLGVTLYEMLTGKLPFPEGKRGGQLSQVRCPPERLRRYRQRIAVGLEDIVLQCLDREPAQRPSIKSLLPALHDLIVEGPAMWPAQFSIGSSEPAAPDGHLTAA